MATTPAATPLRQRVRQEMAAGMMVAAEEVFADSGLSKAHVEDIARRAGVAVGTLYNYYKDRDALLFEVLKARIEELTAELDGAMRRTQGESARGVLHEMTRTYLRFVLRRRTFVRILSEGELAQLSESYPTSAAVPHSCWKAVRIRFETVLARGVAEGELDDVSPDLDAWLFLGLLRGVVMRDLRGEGQCREDDADRVIDLFFDGARAR